MTDLAFGVGGALGRLFASSLDRTLHVCAPPGDWMARTLSLCSTALTLPGAQVFEVIADKPVSTTVLPEGLLSLCVHPSQALVYAGGSEGSLFEVRGGVHHIHWPPDPAPRCCG